MKHSREWLQIIGSYVGILLLLTLAGCASTGSNVKAWNPLTWFSGSEARAQAKAVAAVDTKREAVLKAAQIASHETAAALAAAPASRPVEVASDASQTSTALLDQALGAVPVADLAALRARVAALLSENAAIRTAAEREQAAVRADAAELSRDLAAAAAARAKAEAGLAAAFARENALANQLRNQRFVLFGLGLLSVIATAGWIYLRVAAGGLPGAIGKALAFADKQSPEKAANVREILDPLLNRIEQARIKSQRDKFAVTLS